MDPPNINCLLGQNWGASFIFRYQQTPQTNISTYFEGATPRGLPQTGPLKIKFLHDQVYIACVFDISRYVRGKYFDRVWGYHPPPNGPPKNQFLQQLLLEL